MKTIFKYLNSLIQLEPFVNNSILRLYINSILRLYMRYKTVTVVYSVKFMNIFRKNKNINKNYKPPIPQLIAVVKSRRILNGASLNSSTGKCDIFIWLVYNQQYYYYKKFDSGVSKMQHMNCPLHPTSHPKIKNHNQ